MNKRRTKPAEPTAAFKKRLYRHWWRISRHKVDLEMHYTLNQYPRKWSEDMKLTDFIGGGESLKHGDVDENGDNLTINSVERKDWDDGPQLQLGFAERSERLGLNKTNLNTLRTLFQTDEADDLLGKRINVYRAQTDFQGKRVDCVRVRAVSAGNGQVEAAGQAPTGKSEFDRLKKLIVIADNQSELKELLTEAKLAFADDFLSEDEYSRLKKLLAVEMEAVDVL